MVLQWHNVLAMCSGERMKILEDAWSVPVDCGAGSLVVGSGSLAVWPEPCEVRVPRDAAEVRLVSEDDLERSMDEASNRVKPWDGGSFRLVRRLQEAPGNRGVVDMMTSRLHRGSSVAVKRMPTKWVTFGPGDFMSWHPKSPERPWQDLGIMLELNARGFPYACEFLGIYCDQDTTYVVTSLAEDGDLFSWSVRGPRPGPEREALMQPIVLQIFTAVRWLHELGIAHRDLSLENVLLTHGSGGRMRAKLIDFGMATCARWCRAEVRGKETYQAPEMHCEAAYDAWLADAFQLGSLLFPMAVQDYPWASTKPGACSLFSSMQRHGFRNFLATKELRKSDGRRLAEILSPELARLLEGLLELRPERRLCLGEGQLALEGRRSVWDEAWLEGAAESSDAARPWPCPVQEGGMLAPL
jgi:serine/threonine protein kinase